MCDKSRRRRGKGIKEGVGVVKGGDGEEKGQLKEGGEE